LEQTCLRHAFSAFKFDDPHRTLPLMNFTALFLDEPRVAGIVFQAVTNRPSTSCAHSGQGTAEVLEL